jgi:hypothetical protein
MLGGVLLGVPKIANVLLVGRATVLSMELTGPVVVRAECSPGHVVAIRDRGLFPAIVRSRRTGWWRCHLDIRLRCWTGVSRGVVAFVPAVVTRLGPPVVRITVAIVHCPPGHALIPAATRAEIPAILAGRAPRQSFRRDGGAQQQDKKQYHDGLFHEVMHLQTSCVPAVAANVCAER